MGKPKEQVCVVCGVSKRMDYYYSYPTAKGRVYRKRCKACKRVRDGTTSDESREMIKINKLLRWKRPTYHFSKETTVNLC